MVCGGDSTLEPMNWFSGFKVSSQIGHKLYRYSVAVAEAKAKAARLEDAAEHAAADLGGAVAS
jgi:hypothetical protein